MTSYDRAVIQDILFRMEKGINNIQSAIYELTNFADFDISDNIQQNIMNIQNLSDIIKTQLTEEANKINAET